MSHLIFRQMFRVALLSATVLSCASSAFAAPTDPDRVVNGNNGNLPLPTGQYVTPQLVPGANIQSLNPGLAPSTSFPTANQFVAGGAVRAVLSPDGTNLAVITAGSNAINTGTSQYLFIYDVTGANKSSPNLKQVIKQTNASVGLVWKDNADFYVTGGKDDSVVL